MESTINLKNIEFWGKHAEIIEKLSVTQDNNNSLGYNKAPLFNRILDTMFIAGLIGLICKKKGAIDKSINKKKNIFSDTVYNNINDINFYSAIPIIKERDLSKTIEVKRAFFTEGDENYINERFKIFYSYVLGGLEILDKEILNQYEDKDKIESEIDIFSKFEDFLEELLGENQSNNLDLDIDLDIDLGIESNINSF